MYWKKGETQNKRKEWHKTHLAKEFSAENVDSCFVSLIHTGYWSPTRQGREELREPTCLPLDCVLSGGRGWRHLRHITGPLIKTHVRQSDRHGKTVWKKLLGIKYIVTTWFQRFINKLTDHLVSIRSDRSTNPGISALGLVGGGRRWLSMRGDIEGKVLAGSRGDHYLHCFTGDQCARKPLLHLLCFNRFVTRNQARIRKSREATHWPSVRKERSIEFAVFLACTNGAVNYANKHNWLRPFTLMHLPFSLLHL